MSLRAIAALTALFLPFSPLPAVAQAPTITSATLADSLLTVIGTRLAGASSVTVGRLSVGGLVVNASGTLLMGTVMGTLGEGSHLLSITTSLSAAGSCPTPRPGVDWICIPGGAWVPPDHPLASQATVTASTTFVLAVGGGGSVGPQGSPGPAGATGSTGPVGATGPQGTQGIAGAIGPAGAVGATGAAGGIGPTGSTGPTGPPGPAGAQGLQGSAGAAGTTGATGATGPAGPSGTLDFASSFALMPSDNPATVANGAHILFPQDGPSSSLGGIVRTGPSSFNLANIGVYHITYQASVTEAGQLVLTLNSTVLPHTAVGRATGTSQIMGTAIVQTTTVNSILSVANSAAGVLTLTPFAGGTQAVSAQLVIVRLQ